MGGEGRLIEGERLIEGLGRLIPPPDIPPPPREHPPPPRPPPRSASAASKQAVAISANAIRVFVFIMELFLGDRHFVDVGDQFAINGSID